MERTFTPLAAEMQRMAETIDRDECAVPSVNADVIAMAVAAEHLSQAAHDYAVRLRRKTVADLNLDIDLLRGEP